VWKRKAAAHGGSELLKWGDSDNSWEAEAELELSFQIKLISSLEPEPLEWLLPVGLCGLFYFVKVFVSLFGVRVVDVWKETDDADD
jgi:hypothetical protein